MALHGAAASRLSLCGELSQAASLCSSRKCVNVGSELGKQAGMLSAQWGDSGKCNLCPRLTVKICRGDTRPKKLTSTAVIARAADGMGNDEVAEKKGVKWTATLHTFVPAGPKALGLALTVISLSGQQETIPRLDDKAVGDPVEFERGDQSLLGRTDHYAFDLPDEFVPAAVKFVNLENEGDSIFRKGGEYESIFVQKFCLKSNDGDAASGEAYFLANSFILPVQKDRLFLRYDAFTDPKLRTNDVIIGLQDAELAELRGEGADREKAQTKRRVAGDRIYLFATYNDLGKDEEALRRPFLGGSDEFPYPRRLATNRAHSKGPEVPPDDNGAMQNLVELLKRQFGIGSLVNKALPTAFVPEDDAFSAQKSVGFLGNAILDVLPDILINIDSAVKREGSTFSSVDDVLKLYAGTDVSGNPETLKVDSIGADYRTGEMTRGGGLELNRYTEPLSLVDRFDTWSSDEEFGRLYLAGQNPVVVKAVDSEDTLNALLGNSAIKDTDIIDLLENKTFAELAKEAESGGERRLFVADYSALLAYLAECNTDKARVQHAGRAVLFRRSDGYLVPVAIELTHKKEIPPTVYTSKDPPPIWTLAKCIFSSVDFAYHEVVSHFLRTHACTEPYLIALRRQLPAAHPIFRVMIPHFRYTLAINSAARSQLINANGVIEAGFSPGPYSMQLSSKIYGSTWQFKDEGIVADLRKRGITDSENNLKVTDYPYAEDGLLLWNALHRYFTDYVNYFYEADDAVVGDKYVVNWWKDVRENGHPDKKDGWIELTGKSSLVDIMCTIAWVASAHHAAVNFGQYDYNGWVVSHSSLCRRVAPQRDSEEWKKLAGFVSEDEFEKELLTYLSPRDVATKIITVLKLLSAHAKDEQYLSSEAERQDWLPLEQDPALKKIFTSFVDGIKAAEATIEKRNEDSSRLTRTSNKGGLGYTLLKPTSKHAGVTFMGVPYSISI